MIVAMPKAAPARLDAKDRLITSLDHGVRTILGIYTAGRPSPATSGAGPALDAEQARLSGALMRVNHVGEICAQALYQSQALFSRDEQLRRHFEHAAQEEIDHLAWTRERVQQLDTHTSRLVPLWYGGAFVFGTLAGLAGDKLSLGFVVETERQVEQHLASHLDRLPAADQTSRAIVEQMKQDEARHADEAQAAGATPLPAPVKGLMRLAAKVMTLTAHHI